MKKYIGAGKFFMAVALSFTLFGVVACSDDDSSGTAPAKDEKTSAAKDANAWNAEIKSYDAFKDLPDCGKSSGVVQVFDKSNFYACRDGEWKAAIMVFPAYDSLVECDASLNGFSAAAKDEKGDLFVYACDEGKWVKGNKDNAAVAFNFGSTEIGPSTGYVVAVRSDVKSIDVPAKKSGIAWYFVEDMLAMLKYPDYESLPECNAKMDGNNAIVSDEKKGEDETFTCRDGQWEPENNENNPHHPK